MHSIALSRRERWVLAQLSQLRRSHPELTKPLDWRGLRRVIERAGLRLLVEPIARPAMLIATGFGRWAILVNHGAPRRRHPYYAAHELGHYVLHVEGGGPGRWEACYQMDDAWPADPHEDEAELFATAVLEGPDAAVTRWLGGDRVALPRDLRTPAGSTPVLPDPAMRIFERMRRAIETAIEEPELDELRSAIERQLTWHGEASHLLELIRIRRRELER